MMSLTYADVYKNLDGMVALATAMATPLRRAKDEKDTAFVKRIVATYVVESAKMGAHDMNGETARDGDR